MAIMAADILVRVTVDHALITLAIEGSLDIFAPVLRGAEAIGRPLAELFPQAPELVERARRALRTGRDTRALPLSLPEAALGNVVAVRSAGGTVLGAEITVASRLMSRALGVPEAGAARALPQPDAGLWSLFDQLDLGRLVHEVVERALRTTAADLARVLLYDADTQELVVQGGFGADERIALGRRIPAAHGLAASILAAPGVYDIGAARAASDDALAMTSMGTALGLPFHIGSRVIGLLALGAVRRDAFDRDQRQQLAASAPLMALALDRAQLYEAEHQARTGAERTTERLLRLQSITTALAGAMTPAQAASIIARQAMAAIGASGGTVRLFNTDRDGLVEVASVGFSERFRAGLFWVPISAPLPMAEVARNLEPMLYESIDELTERYPRMRPFVGPDEVRSLVVVPLAIGQEAIGVLTLGFAQQRAFTADDRVFLDALALQCAQALERARLYAAEQAARRHADEAHAQIDTLFATAPIGVALVDREFRFVRLNSYFARLNGIAVADQLGQRAPDLHPSLAGVLERSWCEVIETGTPIVELAASAQLQGQERHLLLTFYPIRLPNNLITGVGTVLIDITDRKRIETATRVLAEASRELVGAVDYSATLAAVARIAVPSIADFCVVTLRNEDQGASVQAVVHRDPEREVLLHSYASSLTRAASGSPSPFGLRLDPSHALLIPDLEALAARTGVPAKIAEAVQALGARSAIVASIQVRGATIGALAFVLGDSGRAYREADVALAEELAWRCSQAIEVSRLYSAERRARRSAERTATRIAQMQAITAALAETLTPRQIAEVISTRAADAIDARSCSIALLRGDKRTLEIIPTSIDLAHTSNAQLRLDDDTPLAHVVRTGTTQIYASSPARQSIQARPAGGRAARQPEQAVGIAIPLIVNGHAIGAMELELSTARTILPEDRAFMEVLSQQCAQALERSRLYEAERSMRAEAEAAVHLRDQFLTIAAHELKTPLTTLMGNAELFQRRHAKEDDLNERDQRNIGMIIDQARRLNRMIAALLDISRIQSGQLSIEQAPIDLVRLLMRVVAEVRLSLTQHTIEVASEIPKRHKLIVLGDELRLEQVLQNLLQNAIKYSPGGGLIQVQLQHRGQYALIAITDRGIGVPSEAMPLLFQRFYRATNADPRHISGMGVGLYVVREILELHGGSIDVESTEGQGSTFTVELPLMTSVE
jgi:PAS domain S-box-containing protein